VTEHYRSNGKLLLTGEYLVLDGAKSLCIPTKKGQSFSVEATANNQIDWISKDVDDQIWFKASFDLSLNLLSSTDQPIAKKLVHILINAFDLSESTPSASSIVTALEFKRDWGLGSSSTLLNNIAQWLKIDPFDLHFKVSNGSGYDIANASNSTPLLYKIGRPPQIEVTNYNPSFSDQLFFVHLNNKQVSEKAVMNYSLLKSAIDIDKCCDEATNLTHAFLSSGSKNELDEVIEKHEFLLSNILQQESIHEVLFSNYKDGTIKSLGAWGGDFVLVTGNSSSPQYFKDKGFETVIPFNEMIL